MDSASTFETVLGILVGLGLSAAVGLRIFVPFLVMSIAAKADVLPLAEGFAWIESTPALVAFLFATVLEVAAYWIPWLDNALDALAAPVTVVAGVLATASVVTDVDPFLKWTVAVIAGGGAAGLLHGGTAALRAGSSVTTGGLANPILSTVELGASLIGSVLAIAVPVLAVLLFAGVLVWARRWLRRRRPTGA
jgi:hypothetical protein